MFLTCNHFAVIYKNKAESLFTSLPPFIIIEDLRIYRVFFTHSINESGLQKILDKLNKYVSSLSSTKEMSFSKLNELEKQCKEILNDYDLYKNTSRKTLLTLILKDKVMIVLYILVLLIIIATVTAYMLHI